MSVVVLNYNYGHYLKGCIESILAQTFTDFELIVIDDCSKDDSIRIIEPYVKADSRVRLVAHKVNAGFAKSLIEGTEKESRGEFLSVISADDLAMRDDAFATQVELLRKYPQAAFCFSAVELITPKGTHVDRSFDQEVVLEPAAALRALFTQTARPPASGTLIRKTHYQASGGYRRDVSMALDLGMWVDLAIQGGFIYTPLPLYGWRIHDAQMSAALPGVRKSAHEVRRILSDAWRQGAHRGFEMGASEDRVFVQHVEAYALHEAFNRSRKLAASRVLAAVLETPLEAAKSRKLWISAARVALGDRGFETLKRVLAVVPFRN